MRRMKGLAAFKQSLFDGRRGWRAEQDFEDGGSVYDDHRELRSSRRIEGGLPRGRDGTPPGEPGAQFADRGAFGALRDLSEEIVG